MWICSLGAQIPWPDSQPEAKEERGGGGGEMSEPGEGLRESSVL